MENEKREAVFVESDCIAGLLAIRKVDLTIEAKAAELVQNLTQENIENTLNSLRTEFLPGEDVNFFNAFTGTILNRLDPIGIVIFILESVRARDRRLANDNNSNESTA